MGHCCVLWVIATFIEAFNMDQTKQFAIFKAIQVSLVAHEWFETGVAVYPIRITLMMLSPEFINPPLKQIKIILAVLDTFTIFCSTRLPLARTRWVLLTLSSLFPLS